MHDYLTETKMLDYSNENIKQLIRERKWSDMAEFERLKAIYSGMRYCLDIMWMTVSRRPGCCGMAMDSATPREHCSWRCLEPAISRAECMDLPLIKSYRRAL